MDALSTVLTVFIAAFLSMPVEAEDEAVSEPPWESVPVTVAVFSTLPASMSSCVTVYVAVPVTEEPAGMERSCPFQSMDMSDRPGRSSSMAMPFIAMFPVLDILNE